MSMKPPPVPLQWGHALTSVETGNEGAGFLTVWNGFNGATLSRAWKPIGRTEIISLSMCFNGATLSRAWKQAQPFMRPAMEDALQWGHALTSVETWGLARCKNG